MTAVGVCGFGRCGSTMLMRALDAGGVKPTDGSSEIGYEVDPGRLYDLPQDGRAVKLLDCVLHGYLCRADWKFVWLDRNSLQQAKSHAKLLRTLGVRVPTGAISGFERSHVLDRPRALAALHDRGPVLELSYEYAVAEPYAFMGDVADFLAPLPLDVKEAARTIHRRSPKCRRDMAFEISGVAPEGVTP